MIPISDERDVSTGNQLPDEIGVVEPPPPPLKRYYGRKRDDRHHTTSSDSETSLEETGRHAIGYNNNTGQLLSGASAEAKDEKHTMANIDCGIDIKDTAV